MMAGQKEAAEILRYGLIAGFHTVADAVGWADSLIVRDPKPDIAVIDIALSAASDVATVAALLGSVGGECDPVMVMRRSIAEMRAVVLGNADRGIDVARWLYRLANAGCLPEEHFGSSAYSLDDRFDLARSGTYGTEGEALDALRGFLDQYAAANGLSNAD